MVNTACDLHMGLYKRKSWCMPAGALVEPSACGLAIGGHCLALGEGSGALCRAGGSAAAAVGGAAEAEPPLDEVRRVRRHRFTVASRCVIMFTTLEILRNIF